MVESPKPERRDFLAVLSRMGVQLALTGGVSAVMLESFARNRLFAARAVQPRQLWDFHYPEERESFAPGLVRRAVSSVDEFYSQSKCEVEPSINPIDWRLQITLDGQRWKSYSYAELLSLPRFERFTTMRCGWNTLNSNKMGTAAWSGISLCQLVDPGVLGREFVEAAFIGVDGHDDSIPVNEFFAQETFLALGMNGKTLDRVHGFPVRLIAPRYYGLKSVKWLAEIRLTSKPYFGVWPEMGFTKQPIVHTMSYIDRVQVNGRALGMGGVSFAGLRGVKKVQIRADQGPWIDVVLEAPLSPYTWTRWKGELPVGSARMVEARALDGAGNWQAERESPLFPDGVKGPAVKLLT
jgi:DMSO/TMAO reductase YedYZ molybdopterin-dependent catalytic subunit